MALDRKDYKTAIPQLEKQIKSVEQKSDNGLAKFDILQQALEAERLARQKAILKVDESVDLVTVKMYYVVKPTGVIPTADDANWSETMPTLDSTNDDKVLWYKSKTFRNGVVVNETAPQQIQLMNGVFSFINTVSGDNGWTTIDGDTISTGRIQDKLTGDNYFDLDDGTFNFGDSNGNYIRQLGNGVEIQGTLSLSSTVGTGTLNDIVADMADFAQDVIDINGDIQGLQSQIDGNITTWFYAYVPTNSNSPASNWISTGTENVHLGDLFYDTTTGYAYRWQSDGATPPNYSWLRITDSDVTKALADAAAAQDTADGKRRVFVTTPTPPYDVGDLWCVGSSGDILTCTTAKADTGAYSSSDWEKLNKYTDDTVANSALGKANSAVATTVSLYYRSTTQSTPSINTSTTIGTATNTSNAWEYVMPVPKRGCYFYTCEKYTSVDGTVTFSTVRELSNATYESKWVSSNDATYIDGGRLYANSVTADQINTNTLTVGSLSDGSSYSTTTQMNTAISDAVDNIELGGRNYLENSRTMGGYFTNYSHSAGDRSHVVWDDDYCYVELIGSASDWNGMVGMPTHRMDPVLLDGSDWTVSFDYKCSSNTTAFFTVAGSSLPIGYLLCHSSSRTKYTSWDITLENTSGEWQRTEIHFNKKVSDLTTGSGDVTSWFIQLYNRTANTLQVRKVKLERGNIATDWTPAPEDITTGGGNNLLRGTATMGNSSGGLWSDGLFYGSGTGTKTFKYAISDSPISNISTGFLSTATSAGTTVSNGFAQGRVPVAKKQVVISAWVKGTAGDYVSLQPIWTNASAERPEGGQMNWQLPDSNWHRLEWWRMPMYDHSDGYATATTYTLNAGYVYHRALTVGNTLTVCGLKLEYGGKATDWSPSTLEVDSAIDDAAKTASRYITAIDESGIKVHAENNVNVNYSLVNADGLAVYKGSEAVAQFGQTARIGALNGSRVEVKNDVIAAYTSNGIMGFEVNSSGDQEEIYKIVSIQGVSGQHTYTHTLTDTLQSNTTSEINVYLSDGNTYNLTGFTNSGSSQIKTSSPITVTYNGNKTYTITNSNTSYKIEVIDIIYSYTTTPTTVTIPYNLTLQDLSLTDMIFHPEYKLYESTSTLSTYQSRVAVVDGGYVRVGNWVYVNVLCDVNTALSANNTWAVLDGFPNPISIIEPVFPCWFIDASDSYKRKGTLSAFMVSNDSEKGRLALITQGTALANNDSFQVNGWYLSDDTNV